MYVYVCTCVYTYFLIVIPFKELLMENKLALQRGRNAGLVWTHGRAVNWIHWVKDHSSSEWHCLQIRQEEVRAHIQFPFAVPCQGLVFLCSFSLGVIEVQELAFCQILGRGRNHHGSRLARCFSRVRQDKPWHLFHKIFYAECTVFGGR